MIYGNPHLRMRWQDLAPCLLDEDFHDIVERLRTIDPELVLFARGFHFPDHRQPRYATMPVRFYKDYLSFVADPGLTMACGPFGLALRVPWSEDLASGNPGRLIGHDTPPPAFRLRHRRRQHAPPPQALPLLSL